MEKIDFELENHEYIELKNLLKITGVLQTGGQIKILLEQEDILYNNEIAFQKRKKCYINDVIVINGEIEITIK